MLDLPPAHDAPPAVVVAHDEAATTGTDDALTRSIRAQIAAAYSAGALPQSRLIADDPGGGTIVPPPHVSLSAGDPTIVPPHQH